MNNSNIAIVAGDAHPDLAYDVARLCGAPVIPTTVAAFADGETRVRIDAEVGDADVYIVQPTSPPANERLMTLALIADAARAGGAGRVTALVPYFGYARQDVRKHPGEPRSARLAACLLNIAGIDRLVVLELHSPALESAFEMQLVQLEADELMVLGYPGVERYRSNDRFSRRRRAQARAALRHRTRVDLGCDRENPARAGRLSHLRGSWRCPRSDVCDHRRHGEHRRHDRQCRASVTSRRCQRGPRVLRSRGHGAGRIGADLRCIGGQDRYHGQRSHAARPACSGGADRAAPGAGSDSAHQWPRRSGGVQALST